MMRKTVRRGRVVLAATAAAALAACGDDTAAADTDRGSSSTTTSTTATPTSGSASTSGAASSSTTLDPDTSAGSSDGGSSSSSEGGTTGSTGDPGDSSSSDGGSTGDPAVSLTPEQACPFDVSFYETGEFAPNPASPGQSVFAGPSAGESASGFLLWEGTASSDQIRVNGGQPDDFPCVVAGDGDDLIEWEFGESTEGGSYATISGGLGADTFAYRSRSFDTNDDETPVHTIVDFESGVDRIYFDATLSRGFDAAAASVVFEDDFEGGTVDGPRLTVDNANGDVWLSAFNGEQYESNRIIHLEGEVELVEGDVVIDETIPGCPVDYAYAQDFREGDNTGEIGVAITGEGASFSGGGGIGLGSVEDDVLSVSAAEGTNCATASDGDDVVQTFISGLGETSETSPYVAGGPGEDTFAVNHNLTTTNPGTAGIVAAHITDFEPGVDTLALNVNTLDVGEVGEAVVTFIDGYDADSVSPTSSNGIVIDAMDGEVWVTNGETGSSVTVFLDGAPAITEDDVLLY